MTCPPLGAGRLILRSTAIGAVLAGVVGGIVGLIVGLRVHPPTAWFAIFEIGIPVSILGGFVGLAGGTVAYAARRANASNSGSNDHL